MRGSRRVLAAALLAALAGVLPRPALAWSPPRTRAATAALGRVEGASRAVRPAFPIDFVGVSWTAGGEPSVRFLSGSAWTPWIRAEHDELPSRDGRTFSRLVAAGGAAAYQVRGRAHGVRAVAINTTDGPSAPSQPGVVSRAAWGADESLRFRSDGAEEWPQAFYQTHKLIVHHTATANDDPDPAATVRAIYRYHAVDRAFGDIGYNFLVDGQGRIYKGRYSGALGTRDADTLTGEDDIGRGVTAAHTGGWNSGTMGIAVLGTYTSTPVPAPARAAAVDHLAWEADRHAIDPRGTDTFTNPVSGEQATTPNISGHRDWAATECPGGTFYGDLPEIRDEVAARLDPDQTPPSAPAGLTATGGKRKIALAWTASSDDRGVTGYEIWRSASSTGAFSMIATTEGTSYTNTRLPRRATFWYRVVAFDAAGNRSAPSATASARTS